MREEEIEIEIPRNVNTAFSRGTSFTRSLRFARTRMSKLSKRLARSADDLKDIQEETTEKQQKMAPETKFSHPKKHEFDYNSALELEFDKWRKLYGEKAVKVSLNDNNVNIDLEGREHENKTSPGNLTFESISLSQIITRGRTTKKYSLSASSSSTSEKSKQSGNGRHPVTRQLSILSNRFRRTTKKGSLSSTSSSSSTSEKSKQSDKHPVTRLVEAMKLKRQSIPATPGLVALTPLRSEQYVRDTRRTLMLDGLDEKCECVITDKDDGEVQFSCVLSQEGIVCRNYRTMLDIVSIGCLQPLTEDDPIGVYNTIEGYSDGQIARIRKGKTFSRIKYQLNLVTPDDQRVLLSLPNSSVRPTSPLPVLKQSLTVHREWGNILKIQTKTNNIPIATIQKEMLSQRYWLHLEPNVDCCFVSAIAAYLLRRQIFGDRLPKVLKSQRSNFVRRARRLSLSVRRKKRARPASVMTDPASAT